MADRDGALLSDGQLADLKQRMPVADIARQWVRLRTSAGKLVGPCPLCSRNPQSKTSSRFEIARDGQGWMCAVCPDGGDVIRLVMKYKKVPFREAVAWLGGPRAIDPADAARIAADHATKAAETAKASQKYREIERTRLFEIWNHAVPLPGSSAQAYLALRGIALPDYGALRLRCVPDMPYFHGRAPGEDGREHERIVHRGPAMVAPVVRHWIHDPAQAAPAAGDPPGAPGPRFCGLHFTYLDLAQRKGKAVIADPETGELLPAKKSRGSIAGAHIELVGPRAPRRVIIGEGIETVLSVWLALMARGLVRDTAFWSAVDLGNIGGKAAESIAHPTDTTPAGRPRRVPGPVPDLTSPGIAFPDCVNEVVLLGDGDSDPVLTEAALVRGAARMATPARVVRVAMAPLGRDFNDLLMGDAAA